jgi:hypothetical protein
MSRNHDRFRFGRRLLPGNGKIDFCGRHEAQSSHAAVAL